MAPPSPRRSSRARTAYPPSQQSSASSATSSRPDRLVKPTIKPASSKSTPTASVSSEPLDEVEGNHPLRRRRGTTDEQRGRTANCDLLDMGNASDDVQDEDDAVRCICGCDEYPGLPHFNDVIGQDNQAGDAEFYASIQLTEDVTGFFLQCDTCKVWQHGACVGIISTEGSPEEYFCEICRKDLHKILTADDGQCYSHYLPLRASPHSSRETSVSKDLVSNKLVPKPSGAVPLSKRRSTMNSRDAAYDDELLRRAIQASKAEILESVELPGRHAKRGRSESDENPADNKRQRTSSKSVSPSGQPIDPAIKDDSDEITSQEPGERSKRSRPSRAQRERPERAGYAKQPAEVSNKRRNKSERRRADDPNHAEELSLASRKPPEGQQKSENHRMTTRRSPDTPPARPPALNGGSHKKNGRTNNGKKKGRNQYTKDRDADVEGLLARSVSRDRHKNTEVSGTAGMGIVKAVHGESKQGSKSKGGPAGHKMTMLDLRRRVAAYLDFISRTQVDLAAESAEIMRAHQEGERCAPRAATSNPDGGCETASAHTSPQKPVPILHFLPTAESQPEKQFKDLSSVEMMDVLTRNLLKWQNQFAD